MTASTVKYDPYDDLLDLDPYPTFKRLRDEYPLYYNDERDFYALSRFDDVRQASIDHGTYASGYGTVFEAMTGPQEFVEAIQSILWEDPPIHDVHRKIMTPAFGPRNILQMEPRIREYCAYFLDPLRDRPSFDFMEEFACKLPMMVIGQLLGVPDDEQGWLQHTTDTFIESQEGGAFNAEVAGELFNYYQCLIEERRSRPRDDMVSDLVAAEFVDDTGTRRHLDNRELLNFLLLLGAAGNETVTRFLGWAAVVLAENPDSRAELVADAKLIPGAVEEILRYEPPSPVQGRRVMADAEWYGQAVPAGSNILLLTAAAARDDRVYDDPDRFDIHRNGVPHLSFGKGLHLCLGATLARLEARVALEEILRRFPAWSVRRDAAVMAHTSSVRGWAKLPIDIG
jgi:cytochrome P450